MNEELPKRKHPRLKQYDYSTPGCYFVTICTEKHRCCLSRIVGRGDLTPPRLELTTVGEVARCYLEAIPMHYQTVRLDAYVIMPNHIHLLLWLQAGQDGGVGSPRPTLPSVIKGFKRMVTQEIGQSIWQTSFYEHVVRNEKAYFEILRYIEENPIKWHLDELYTQQDV